MLVRIVIAKSFGGTDFELRAIGLIPGPCRRAHHFKASQGVDIQKLNSGQADRARHGPFDRVRDIVIFQVEEYAGAQFIQLLQCRGAFSGE